MNQNNKIYSLILPAAVLFISISGFIGNSGKNISFVKNELIKESGGANLHNYGNLNILSAEDLSSGLKDTVYTDKDCWLELRIDKQMLYQHMRDGRVISYPVSTGQKNNDPTSLESRPGLFAIFHKVEHHQSSQFNSANMYNFMPFNQGIGFHSIDGKAYYAYLGVRPSSHGCVRMKHDDVKKLFRECPLGTLVLASKGYSARTVAFAPENFVNNKEYTKEETRLMLAENLYNILNGNYYKYERERFVINPKFIPVSGIYTSYDKKIPERQNLPKTEINILILKDNLNVIDDKKILINEDFENTEDDIVEVSSGVTGNVVIDSSEELIKKYFNNPIGVLPYFGPKR
ncbi:MAG TPA: L,D-transpeptidase [Ignavibacteria bacterium]|nr:L,D-transpeptidase [Ignavibacteria bacterium]